MDSVPAYVSAVFILTTFASIGFLLRAAKIAGLRSLPFQILIFVLPLWIIFQAVLAIGGFYQDLSSVPPRVVLFGVAPAIGLIMVYLIFFRTTFIESLPLGLLTLVHVIRIPVELVLLWLYQSGQIPRAMTFEGLNFDILSGILAPIVYFIAFRNGNINRWILIAYNLLGLVLLANIVMIAVMSLPSPMQQMSFDQPNVAVLYFPYIWLPTIVVPIVLFCHLASLWQLVNGKTA
jgi:hypothetical protein